MSVFLNKGLVLTTIGDLGRQASGEVCFSHSHGKRVKTFRRADDANAGWRISSLPVAAGVSPAKSTRTQPTRPPPQKIGRNGYNWSLLTDLSRRSFSVRGSPITRESGSGPRMRSWAYPRYRSRPGRGTRPHRCRRRRTRCCCRCRCDCRCRRWS